MEFSAQPKPIFQVHVGLGVTQTTNCRPQQHVQTNRNCATKSRAIESCALLFLLLLGLSFRLVFCAEQQQRSTIFHSSCFESIWRSTLAVKTWHCRLFSVETTCSNFVHDIVRFRDRTIGILSFIGERFVKHGRCYFADKCQYSHEIEWTRRYRNQPSTHDYNSYLPCFRPLVRKNAAVRVNFPFVSVEVQLRAPALSVHALCSVSWRY